MSKLKVIERGYSSEVVKILEDALEQARGGGISEIVLVTKVGEEYFTLYSACDNLIQLIGHLTLINDKMIRRARQEI